MSYSTYILLCDNGKYYVGHSEDVQKRIGRHISGNGACFTKQNKPIKLLWAQSFKTEKESVLREKQIKGWSRQKKEKLISGIWK